MLAKGLKLTRRSETFLPTIARLRPGVSLGEARAEAATLASRLERDYPRENHRFGLSVLRERDGRIPFLPGLEGFGRILLVIVGLVFADRLREYRQLAARTFPGAP